jgi:hypothetical protein
MSEVSLHPQDRRGGTTQASSLTEAHRYDIHTGWAAGALGDAGGEEAGGGTQGGRSGLTIPQPLGPEYTSRHCPRVLAGDVRSRPITLPHPNTNVAYAQSRNERMCGLIRRRNSMERVGERDEGPCGRAPRPLTVIVSAQGPRT